MNLRIHPRLAHPARDELRELRAVVDDRMREDTVIGSDLPHFRSAARAGVRNSHLARVEVEHRRRRRAVQPTAPLAGIHDQRFAARLHLLLMRVAVHHDLVREHRPLVDVADVVDEQHSPAADLEAVRRLEQLDAKRRLRARDQSFVSPSFRPNTPASETCASSNAVSENGEQ